MKNYLLGRRCYVGGPIEHDTHAYDWRTEVKKKLVGEFGLKVFDPADDPKQGLREKIVYCKEHSLWDELREVVSEFVMADLSVVDHSDFIIQHLPYKVPTTGTHHEIINASNLKKPTLLVCPQGKKHIADWYFGFIKHEYMFGSWQELYAYLHEVAEGKHIADRRWFFVYKYNDLAWIK